MSYCSCQPSAGNVLGRNSPKVLKCKCGEAEQSTKERLEWRFGTDGSDPRARISQDGTEVLLHPAYRSEKLLILGTVTNCLLMAY